MTKPRPMASVFVYVCFSRHVFHITLQAMIKTHNTEQYSTTDRVRWHDYERHSTRHLEMHHFSNYHFIRNDYYEIWDIVTIYQIIIGFYKFYNMSQNNISLIKHVILTLSTRNKILYAQPAFRPLHEFSYFELFQPYWPPHHLGRWCLAVTNWSWTTQTLSFHWVTLPGC